MSNAKNARDAAAAATAAAEKQRRIKVALTYTGLVAAVLVVVVVIAFVVRNSTKSQAPASTGLASPTTSSAVQPTLTDEQVLARDIKILTTIPTSTYDAVGAGSAAKLSPSTGPALTEGGKPVVVYVGAEFCPYCAGQRWALIAALSRFGTWEKLGRQSSSATDVYPSTSTFTFHGASYRSPYLVFSGTEDQDGNGQPLDTPPARDQQIWMSLGGGSFPFLDLGGRYAISGAQFQPTSLHTNASDTQSAPRSWDEIANALTDPTSAQSKQIIGAANILSAELCTLTNNRPANVCTSAGVLAAR